MTESTNVTPITGGKPPRRPKQYELPGPVSSALWEQQKRVYEALSVARMLEAYLVNAGARACLNVDDLENTARAMVGLLEPIEGLTDSTELMRRGKQILGEGANG